MTDADTVERLRRTFAAPQPGATEGCPEADRLWLAARGELSAEQTAVVVDHLALCGPCGEAWAMAAKHHSHAGDREMTAVSAPRQHALRRWTFLAAAAALTGVLLLVGVRTARGPGLGTGETLRTQAVATVRSLVPEDRPLARSAFVLRWTAGPPGTRYDVRVTDAALSAIASADGLEVAEFLVPEEALESLAPGESVFWRVEVRLPDGRRLAGPAFLALVD